MERFFAMGGGGAPNAYQDNAREVTRVHGTAATYLHSEPNHTPLTTGRRTRCHPAA